MNLWKRRRPQLPESFFVPGGPVQTRLLRIVTVVCVIGALPGFRLWQVYSLCMTPLEVSKETTLVGGRNFDDFRDAGREVIASATGLVTTWMTEQAALEMVGGDAWRELPGEPLLCAELWSSEGNAERASVVKARVEPLTRRFEKSAGPLGVDIHKGEPRWTDPVASLRVAKALSCRVMDSAVDLQQAVDAVRLGVQASALLAQSSDASVRQTGTKVREQIAGTALRRACNDVAFRDALTHTTELAPLLDARTHLRLTRLSLLPELIQSLTREASHAPPSVNINTLLRRFNEVFDEAELALQAAASPQAAIDAVQALVTRRRQGARAYAEHNGLFSTLWDPEAAVTARSNYRAELLAASYLASLPSLIESHARAAHLSTLVTQLATDADAVCALAAATPQAENKADPPSTALH